MSPYNILTDPDISKKIYKILRQWKLPLMEMVIQR